MVISVQSLDIFEKPIDHNKSAQRLLADWAWIYKHSYSCDNGSHLYQITLQLSCIDDIESPDLARIKLLAYELLAPFGRFGTSRKFGTGDPNAEILYIAIELANCCSEIGRYDTADAMFEVLMNGSLVTFDRIGKKFDKIRSYIWYAHYQQRPFRWENSVTTVCDGYRILTSTLLFSGNAVEYHRLSEQLKSALDGISLAWKILSNSGKMEDLLEMDGNLDVIIADNKAARTGISKLNGDSAGWSSSNPGRYGVTYSESMMSGISFNYSALF